ncbi:hypothetical protein PVAG01_07589 [Phlyctema vagabunda]|uniref:Uncharacterized protein n=1 Tax=Phlyctema vagabunda TaxID=108571 RepID=A0ABR4PCV6_9HELO
MASQAVRAQQLQPKDMSDSQFIKFYGLDNMPHFLVSHGLNIEVDEEYAEGKVILIGLRKWAQQSWELEHDNADQK